MAGWIYANDKRTDGEITPEDLAIIAGYSKITHLEVQNAASELVTAQLWTSGYRIANYLEWCDSAEVIERKSADTRRRQHDWYERHKGSPDPSKSDNTDNTEPQKTDALDNALGRTGETDPVGLHFEAEDIIHTPTPEQLAQRKAAAGRNREIARKAGLPVAP